MIPKLDNRKWKVLKSEKLLSKGTWMNLRQERVQLPSGSIVPEWFVLEFPTWINVIAITKDGLFVMEDQYRHALGQTHFELVAGVVDEGETPLEAAKRELSEETGFGGGEWKLFLTTSPNPTNHTFGDQEVIVFKGNDHIFEEMEGLRFKVGPKSFYQTNTDQAYNLYKVARSFAQLTGNELVYDLYTGTGTIANFVSRQARQVIGIEYVPEAIEDAKVNSQINNISNTLFFAGDMKDILTDDFIAEHGRPDVIITDPPRVGMHKDVVNVILNAAPQRIVYVSCNPATQARDLQLLDEHYRVEKVQPVDMFPHTQHVENVVLLVRRDEE